MISQRESLVSFSPGSEEGSRRDSTLLPKDYTRYRPDREGFLRRDQDRVSRSVVVGVCTRVESTGRECRVGPETGG